MAGRALEMEKDVIKTRERAKILARSKNCFMKSLSIFSLNLLSLLIVIKQARKEEASLVCRLLLKLENESLVSYTQ